MPTDALPLPVAWLFDPGERLYIGFLLSSFALALAVLLAQRTPAERLLGALLPKAVFLHRSSLLDYQLFCLKLVFKALIVTPLVVQAITVTALVAAALRAAFGAAPPFEASRLGIAVGYTVVAFLVDDATRFLLHRAMHHVPGLFRIHRVHHSAEVLTPFTLHRVHPLETLLYAYRAALSTGLVTGIFFHLFRSQLGVIDVFGINALGFAFNVLGANLRHSHIWLSYGRRIERFVLSPAQHQIHHSALPEHRNRNFGTYLAVWDRLAGTLHVPDGRPELAFGLSESGDSRTEPLKHGLGEALLAPFERHGRSRFGHSARGGAESSTERVVPSSSNSVPSPRLSSSSA